MRNQTKEKIGTLLCTAVVAAALSLSACVVEDDSSAARTAPPAESAGVAPMPAADTGFISAPSYEAFAADTAGTGARMARFVPFDSVYKRIDPRGAESKITRFPATIPPGGATTLHVQILLDRASFSPGIIDGMWGDNAARHCDGFGSPTTSIQQVRTG